MEFDQIVVTIIVVTLVLLVVVYKIYDIIASKKVKINRVMTNADQLVGKKGIVVKKITALEKGYVKVETREWLAKSKVIINEGELVFVQAIEGATLIVAKIN